MTSSSPEQLLGTQTCAIQDSTVAHTAVGLLPPHQKVAGHSHEFYLTTAVFIYSNPHAKSDYTFISCEEEDGELTIDISLLPDTSVLISICLH